MENDNLINLVVVCRVDQMESRKGGRETDEGVLDWDGCKVKGCTLACWQEDWIERDGQKGQALGLVRAGEGKNEKLMALGIVYADRSYCLSGQVELSPILVFIVSSCFILILCLPLPYPKVC